MTKRSRRYFDFKKLRQFMERIRQQSDIDFDDDEEEWGYDEEDLICYTCQTCGMDSQSSSECPNCGAYDMEACYF